MSKIPDDIPRLIEELRRRKVVRAALVYGAGAFAALQVADIVVAPLGLPDWVMPSLIWLTLIGFLCTLILSWFFDVSAQSGPPRWVSLRTGVVASALVIVGVGVGWILRPHVSHSGPSAPNGASENVVVVLPFTVLGSPKASYLSDAVARLLSSSLDGVAGLRTVSPHALMGYPGLDGETAVTDHIAQQIADHFGAGLWLTGNVFETGDSLRIDALLVDRVSPGGARISASVTTTPQNLFSSVDQLAALLLAEREAEVGSDRTRTAARTTSSINALRAYIDGERAFRAGSYLSAIESFSRAVEADSAFALAFYRLSMAEERVAWAEASRRSAEAAYRHSERLAPRERQFLEAVLALRRGNTSEAEQLLRSHVRAHPDDPEAWYQLGEILFHGEPLRGGSMTAARDPFERTLFYDPGDLGALYHLVRIAIRDEDAARLDTLTRRFIALSPSGERTLELRALQAVSQGQADTFEAILGEMTESPDPFLPIAVWSVAVFGQNPAWAQRIANLMTAPDRPREVRGSGHVQLAFLALAQGRYTDALQRLTQAERLGDPDAEEARVWFSTLPFVPATEHELRAAAAALETRGNARTAESPLASSFFSAHNGVHETVNLYLQGLVASRLDDQERVAEIVGALDLEGVTAGGRQLARQLAVGVRAQGLKQVGQTDEALRLLSDLEIESWYELTFVSPYYAAAMERFTLAELLLAAGREEEALGWYQGLRDNSVPELVFLGPALLREASIHRRAGRDAVAQQLDARFQDLWASADPDLRQRVRDRHGL